MIDPTFITPAWYLSEQFNVNIAAALIMGYEPSSIVFTSNNEISVISDNWEKSKDMSNQIKAARQALMSAIVSNSLKANIIKKYDFNSEYINWDETTIDFDSIKEWLERRGQTEGFFFSSKEKTTLIPDIKNQNESYSISEDQLSKMQQELDTLKAELDDLKGKMFRHYTPLLDGVHQVQERYWSNNWDKNNPDSFTLKDTIVDWLMKEFRISKKRAEAVEIVAAPVDRTPRTKVK